MKKINVLIVAAMLFMGANFVNAQTKVAHINTQDLIEAMPEMKAAQSQLEKLQKTYDTEIKAMVKELEAKMNQYDSEAASKTQEENKKRVEEVQGMQNNIAAYRQQALQDLQKKEQDLFQPIFDKAKTTIQKVARAQGFQYVLDSTTGGGVLLADGKDLLADVKKELGI
ncbi:MAG TPA: OmpH family outer membrane protein [Flavobacteriaceae bacterium]|nr:OmpH family outer membrane protein [Flavobacteriaceae bacterium]MCB9212312.1 OmpH family outer membrane protein [Alteromonas sp.]HPF12481.1 OmpH family outer membrane protein [Flavobacteriaceae bacterium]HQU22260.1 OmpH family outer membrane protein [Flavobacteriaceae bacterium]HQU65207.1 OmpH family outer membrane protein [Flavobacteriaceae bacterium]